MSSDIHGAGLRVLSFCAVRVLCDYLERWA
jgi:hypothetical protein